MYLLLLCLLAVVLVPKAVDKPKPDLENEGLDLLEIHRQDWRAHFETDAELLLKNSNAEMVSVSSGKINRSSRDQIRQMFTEYFKNAKYYEWDDLEPPIIRISADASMAWMIVNTRVRRTQKLSSGEERETSFVYAGIMTYEKQQGKWVKTANVSTFEERR